MKKVVLIFGFIIILVSCSTDDTTTYEQKSNKTNLFKENTSDFCITCRDSIELKNEKENDTICDEIIDPVKPKKD